MYSAEYDVFLGASAKFAEGAEKVLRNGHNPKIFTLCGIVCNSRNNCKHLRELRPSRRVTARLAERSAELTLGHGHVMGPYRAKQRSQAGSGRVSHGSVCGCTSCGVAVRTRRGEGVRGSPGTARRAAVSHARVETACARGEVRRTMVSSSG